MDKIAEGKVGKLNWKFYKGKKSDNFFNSSKTIKIVASFRAKIDIADKAIATIKTDGLLTNQRVVLFLNTADCIPAIVWWEKSDWFGLLHFHFRGLLRGLIDNFSKTMKECGLLPEKCHVILGPSICPKCYDHKTILRKIKWRILYRKFPLFAHKENGEYLFDLSSAHIAELEKIGIKRKNIKTLDDQLCTYCKLKISRHHKIKDLSLVTILEKK